MKPIRPYARKVMAAELVRPRGGQRGQALAELGIVITVLVLLTLGAIEYGYTFLALHVVTQATAAGARAASVLQVGNRGPCGGITSTGAIQDLVLSQTGSIAQVSRSDITVQQFDSCPGNSPCGPSCTGTPSPTVPCTSSPTTPIVCVTVKGTIPSIFGLRRSSGFTRVQSFRDEGR
jgi:Flp pilus assembly protein TadG